MSRFISSSQEEPAFEEPDFEEDSIEALAANAIQAGFHCHGKLPAQAADFLAGGHYDIDAKAYNAALLVGVREALIRIGLLDRRDGVVVRTMTAYPGRPTPRTGRGGAR